jgi:hypothetical protein
VSLRILPLGMPPISPAAHRFIVRIMLVASVELWGFEPQTSCMP